MEDSPTYDGHPLALKLEERTQLARLLRRWAAHHPDYRDAAEKILDAITGDRGEVDR